MKPYEYILESAIAENTRIAYDKSWEHFVRFCKQNSYCVLPATPQAVIEFLVELATQPVSAKNKPLSMGTVSVYHSAINRKHLDAGYASPTSDPEVINVLRGLRRLKGKPPRRVRALREYQIEAMLNHCDSSPIGLRNAAIIAIGFAAALRRSEICNLRVADIEAIKPTADIIQDTPEKLFLNIRKSKTDQHGKGQKIAILNGERIKPITRLYQWLAVSGIHAGPVFQTMRRGGSLRGKGLHHSDIPRLVKHYAALIGIDANEVAGHSLRAGFVTSAAAHRARLDKIMAVTRHRNPETVLQYIRDADAFASHAGEGFM